MKGIVLLRRTVLVLAAASVGGCIRSDEDATSTSDAVSEEEICAAAGVRRVAERFGERMKRVPVLAADSVVIRAIHEEYAPLVTSDLLDAWMQNPEAAPGRQVSSPWPDRIIVDSVSSAVNGSCRIDGELLFATSADTVRGGADDREAVTLYAEQEDGAWRIRAFEHVDRAAGAAQD